jgi:ABC-2 type transport system permease protein
MLSGLLQPSKGQVRVLGYEPFARQRDFLRRITLVMGNRNQLIWDIPVLDSFERNRAIYRLSRVDFRQTLDELTQLLDLGELLDKPVRNLSLGERMKCEIAVALLHRPQILFLDEPTIGLDVTMQRRIRTFLAEYNKRYGATVLLTSHYMAELVALLGVFFLMSGLIGTLIQPSMQRFMEDVRQGTLDFTLTKPEDAQVLVSVGEVRVWKLLDVVQGLGLIVVALVEVGLQTSLAHAAGFALALVAGAAIVYSFWLILATTSFWFIKVENVLIIFQAVYNAGKYPVAIYPRWLKAAMTFLVPVAFAVTVPSEALVGRLSQEVLLGALGMATAMIVGSRLFWKWGVKHYSGASA